MFWTCLFKYNTIQRQGIVFTFSDLVGDVDLLLATLFHSEHPSCDTTLSLQIYYLLSLTILPIHTNHQSLLHFCSSGIISSDSHPIFNNRHMLATSPHLLFLFCFSLLFIFLLLQVHPDTSPLHLSITFIHSSIMQ